MYDKEYFDYTTYPTEELEKKAKEARAESDRQVKEIKRAQKEHKAQYKAQLKASRAEQKAQKRASRQPMGTGKKVVMAISLGLCFGVFAGAGFSAVQYGFGLLNPKEEQEAVISQIPSQNTTVQTPEYATTQITYVQDDISDVVEEVMPAMVSIISNYTTTTTDFWGQSYRRESASSGSGIIVAENDKELLIVSNNHVVEGADRLEVTFIDGTTAEAQIKGLDSDMDLAVVAVSVESLSEETKNNISVAMLGDSDNLKLGEPVIAIGNALGYGQSVTNGIVSALDRELELEDGSTGVFIQTNAAINPGNSGGALLNINGEVIGINSNKIGGSAVEGMGYAIPISSANPIIADLMERQTRSKVAADEVGYIGIQMQDVTAEAVQFYNMPQGVFVYEVLPGCAAEAAGVRHRDVIVKFDGRKIVTMDDLRNALQYYKAGDTATITVMRAVNSEYESVELEITLGERPKE